MLHNLRSEIGTYIGRRDKGRCPNDTREKSSTSLEAECLKWGATEPFDWSQESSWAVEEEL